MTIKTLVAYKRRGAIESLPPEQAKELVNQLHEKGYQERTGEFEKLIPILERNEYTTTTVNLKDEAQQQLFRRVISTYGVFC
ncbi:hypothetical protein [Nitrincola schmidtii]|uniref:hypothetical protein n=1 Tax=Nitrincola schmidtii TaxID=1730894 RepID=UPI00124E9839|nr:hypothetical protein [Nitrincola schmidtii]